MVTNIRLHDNGTNFFCRHLTVILAVILIRNHPHDQRYLVFSLFLIDRLQARVKHSPSFTMIDPVVAPIRKISKKQRRNVSRNSRYKRLGMRWRERVLVRKKNHAHSSGSSEETSANVENIAMLLFTQELNVPLVSTTSELSISHF